MGKKRHLLKASNGEEEGNRQGDVHEQNISSLSAGDKIRTRNTKGLYASRETYECAMESGCVPCAYKICCFDVALDKEFCKRIPNQRPEQCPRSKQKSNGKRNTDSALLGFRQGMSILTVGDGDFSFSLGVARKLLQFRRGSSQSGNEKDSEQTILVATSYETESTLRKVYPNFDNTLRELKNLGVLIAYEVDATRIEETLSISVSESIGKRRFHRICWNFPCTAIAKGQDGQNMAMEENKELVRNFVKSARGVLTDRGDGELYVCHKTKPPFNQWNLEEVALSAQKRDDESDERSPLLVYSGRIVLDRMLLPPYTPRKALDKKSFPCHDACFYIFAQEYDVNNTSNNLFDPTIQRDEPQHQETKEGNKASLIRIEPEVIYRMRQRYFNSAPVKKKRRF